MIKRFLSTVFLTLGFSSQFSLTAVAKSDQGLAFKRYINETRHEIKKASVKIDERVGDERIIKISIPTNIWKDKDVRPSVWEHWLLLKVPARIKSRQVFLYLSNGSNDDKAPETIHKLPSEIAKKNSMVTAELRMVPSQPLTFIDGGKTRSEDGIIAHSWMKYFETGDSSWIAYAPMIASARETMNYLDSYLKETLNLTAEGYILSGQSKRAWTSWLTAIHDSRVKGLMPIVFDALNLEKNMLHHHKVYGFWAPALKDYEEQGVTKFIGTEKFKNLTDLIDPWANRDKLLVPKYLVQAANDQFFLPDSSQFYFSGLPGDKALRYIANSGHHVDHAPYDYIRDATAAIDRILSKKNLNLMSWTNKNNTLNISCDEAPLSLKLWESESDKRDFRLDREYPAYSGANLSAGRDKEFQIKVKKPSKKWKAYFLEACFKGAQKDSAPYCLTTDVYIY